MTAQVHDWFSGLVKTDAIREGYWFEHTIDLKFDQSANSFGLFDILATYSSSETSKTRTVRVRFDGYKYAVIDLMTLGGCQATMAEFIEGLDDSSKILRDCLHRRSEMTSN